MGGGQAEEDERREDEDERMRWEASRCHFRKRERKKNSWRKDIKQLFLLDLSITKGGFPP